MKIKSQNKYSMNSLKYLVPLNVIKDTEQILMEYRNLNPSNEGLVYWAGTKNENIVRVKLVIAPKTESSSQRITVSPISNVYVIKELSKIGDIQIGQVHSHPGDWVDHSYGDDLFAAFKVEGLISIVVPNYCKDGMKLLDICGIHRYQNGKFIRLSEKLINSNFIITKSNNLPLIDLRT